MEKKYCVPPGYAETRHKRVFAAPQPKAEELEDISLLVEKNGSCAPLLGVSSAPSSAMINAFLTTGKGVTKLFVPAALERGVSRFSWRLRMAAASFWL